MSILAPVVTPAVRLLVLDHVARGSQLPGISERLDLDIRTVRAIASAAGAPDLGAVANARDRLRAAQEQAPDR